jgi:hypothetical protein
MEPVTFYYCDASPPPQHVQVTNVQPPPPLKVGNFVIVIGCPLFYLDCDKTSTFALKRNVDVLSQVTRDYLEAFGLVSRGVYKMSVVKIITRKIAKRCRSF